MTGKPTRDIHYWVSRVARTSSSIFGYDDWSKIMEEKNPKKRIEKLFSRRFHILKKSDLNRAGPALEHGDFIIFLKKSFENMSTNETRSLLSNTEPNVEFSFLVHADKIDAQTNRNIGGQLHYQIIEMSKVKLEKTSKDHASLWQALIDELSDIANRHGPPPATGNPTQKNRRKVVRQKRSSPTIQEKTTSKPSDSPPITEKGTQVKHRPAHVPAITQGHRQQEVQPSKDEYREVPDALELDRLSHSPPEPVVVGSTDSPVDEVAALDVASEPTPDKTASEVLNDQKQPSDDVVGGANSQANEDEGAYFEHLDGTNKAVIEKLHRPIQDQKLAAAQELKEQRRASEGIIENVKAGARQSNERLNQKAIEQNKDIQLRAGSGVSSSSPQTPWTGISQDSDPLNKTGAAEITDFEIKPVLDGIDSPVGASLEADENQNFTDSSASEIEPKVVEPKAVNSKPVNTPRKPLVETKPIAKPSPKPQPKSQASHQLTSESNAPKKAVKGTSLMDRIRQEGKTKKPAKPSNMEKPKPREKPSYEVILESSESVKVYRSGYVDTRIPLADSGYEYTAGTFSNGTVDSETIPEDDPSRDENQDLIVVRKEPDSTLLLMFDGVGGVTFPRQFAEYFAEELLELPSLRSLSAEKFVQIQQNSSDKYHEFYERNIERLTEGKSRIVRRKLESIGSRGASTFLAIEMNHKTGQILTMSLGDSNIFAFDTYSGEVAAMLPNKRATGSVKALDTSPEQFRDLSEVEQKEFSIRDQLVFIMMTDGYSDPIRALDDRESIAFRLTDFCSMMIHAESNCALSRTINGIDQGLMESDDMSYLLLFPNVFHPPEYSDNFPSEEE